MSDQDPRPGNGVRADYSLTARTLLDFSTNPPPATETGRFGWWADLLDALGPTLVPFVIKPSALADIPFAKLGIAGVDPTKMTPAPYEMWVIFRLRLSDDTSGESPLRRDGFMLVLEWRRDKPDSQLLSGAFHSLADLVRSQQHITGWGLHPAFARYGDKVAFLDNELFADADRVLSVASAYGALVAGLFAAARRSPLPYWPFPTIQWDASRQQVAGVEGLAQKLVVATDSGATVVTVADTQEREARRTLAILKADDNTGRLRHLRIHAVGNCRRPAVLAEQIALGDWRRRRRHGRAIAACMSAALFAATIVSLVHYDNHRSFSKYYAAVTYHYGLPEGLFEVPPGEVHNRGQTFRFDYQGIHHAHGVHFPWQLRTWWGAPRKLVRVVNVNSRNVPCEIRNEGYGQMPIIQEFEYDENAQLAVVRSRARGGADFVHGPILRQYVYSNLGSTVNGLVSLRNRDGSEYVYDEISTSQIVSELPQPGRSEINEWILSRDNLGRMTQRRYSSRLEPITDGDGLGGLGFTYDPNGLVTSVTCLGPDGAQASANRWKVTTTDYQWNGPLLSEVTTRGRNGNITPDRLGVMRYRFSHDEHGNVSGFSFADDRGLPTRNLPSPEWPYSFESCTFTWRDGLATSCRRLGISEASHDALTPVTINEYDERGDAVSEGYFDLDGNPQTNELGFAVCRTVPDPQTGRCRSLRTFAVDGITPAADSSNGTFGLDNTFDADGNIIESRNLGADGRLMTNCYGVAVVRSTYENGRLSYQCYYDASNRLARSALSGSIACSVTYRRGRETSIDFYADEAASVPSTNKWGVSRIQFVYDSAGRRIRTEEYGLDGEEASINLRNHPRCWMSVVEHDIFGNITCSKCYSRDMSLMTFPNSRHAYFTARYDRLGRIVSFSWWDADNRPVSSRPGAPREVNITYYRDTRRKHTEEYLAFDDDECGLWGTPGLVRAVNEYADTDENLRTDQRRYGGTGSDDEPLP